MNLLDRLMPSIDTEHDGIRDGKWVGLCAIARSAHKARVITDDEHSALRAAIDAWVRERSCIGFVVFFLSPGFDRMTDLLDNHTYPNETSEGAAKLWKEWAVGIVGQVQEAPDAVRDTLEGR